MDDRIKGQGQREGRQEREDQELLQDERKDSGDHKELVRKHLKVLLLHLAAKSDNPSMELESLLHDVINELYTEVKEALEAKTHLRLVTPTTDTLN